MMDSMKKNARVAGLLYLLVVLTGPLVLIYIPGKLFVPGNASATASNILAHESLLRIHVMLGLVAELLFMFAVLALYRLLKGTSQPLAVAMVVLILIDVPIAILGLSNELVCLSFLRNAQSLSLFEKPQMDFLAMQFLDLDKQGVIVSELFWGLWLLPLGFLVFRSGFLPRFLGVWLILNGLAYVGMSVVGVVSPQNLKMLSKVMTPVLFGEMALMLWLLIIGARPRSPVVATS